MTTVCAILNLFNNEDLLLKLVCTTLTDYYELDLDCKTQPSVNIDDLLYSTYHLLAVCDIVYMYFGGYHVSENLSQHDQSLSSSLKLILSPHDPWSVYVRSHGRHRGD